MLGDLLRAVLRRDSQPESTLDEEIDLTRSYVALEQMRFADRLRVTFEIPDEVKQAMIPCFLMQSFLENAIIHGLRGVRKTGIIAVRAAEEENQLVITVSDNGIGAPVDANGMKTGVGLGSIHWRTSGQDVSGAAPVLHSATVRGGTEVRIAIPLRFANCAPMYDSTNGILTAVGKTTVDGFCQ